MTKQEQRDKIRSYFLEAKETIAVAESVSSGMLQNFFSNIPDAASFYQGGITAYNIGQKYKHLHVEPIGAQDCNCVSANVAEQMAINVCPFFGSQWGIGITGYATPVPQSDNKLFAHYAIAYKDTIKESGKIDLDEMDNEEAQKRYTDKVIEKLTTLLHKS